MIEWAHSCYFTHILFYGSTKSVVISSPDHLTLAIASVHLLSPHNTYRHKWGQLTMGHLVYYFITRSYALPQVVSLPSFLWFGCGFPPVLATLAWIVPCSVSWHVFAWNVPCSMSCHVRSFIGSCENLEIQLIVNKVFMFIINIDTWVLAIRDINVWEHMNLYMTSFSLALFMASF